ncbi:TPA: phosphoribosyl-AMP cyclohydrolase [Candidatus Bathyarchaeota archaeon]|nr:phosphoribosyl-AMP cyclohydrolase [Candidatus Bathyarchaeota archaeon]
MKRVNLSALNFKKGGGLMPVVVQDHESLKILTLAYVNREALLKTIETGYAHYYRRSKGRVMMKGETSGNTQRVIDILVDCDQDAIIYLVKQKGVACHLGEETCFHNRLEEAQKLRDQKNKHLRVSSTFAYS